MKGAPPGSDGAVTAKQVNRDGAMTLITSAGQAEEELPWPTSGSAQRSSQHVTPSTAHNHVVAAMKDVIVRLLYVATRHQVQALAACLELEELE